MKRIFTVLSALTLIVSNLSAQVSLTTNSYSQDFNTLAISGASSSMPTGWFFVETGSNANTTYTAGTGSGTAGDTYSFGAASSSERALGGLFSSSLTPTFGAGFTNNTGGTITSITISYTGEQWRLGATLRTDRIDFQYSTDATSLSTGTWVDVNELDFSSPVTTGTTGALDGNSSPNRTSISSTISSLNITNGSTFFIRWTDFNATSSDDGLAVDDFTMTNDSPLPVSLTSFTASPFKSSVVLNWTTATEVNNYGFDILRQAQDDKWEKIGFVAGHGNSNSQKDYSFTDNNAPKAGLKYRLKQIDTDGSYTYSEVVSVDNALAKTFKLYTAYPNPFNPSTKIKFSIPSSSNVSLKIYDVIGNEIASLVNERKEAGEYEVEFNASNLPSGIYFSTLQSGSGIQTQKLLLIK